MSNPTLDKVQEMKPTGSIHKAKRVKRKKKKGSVSTHKSIDQSIEGAVMSNKLKSIVRRGSQASRNSINHEEIHYMTERKEHRSTYSLFSYITQPGSFSKKK